MLRGCLLRANGYGLGPGARFLPPGILFDNPARVSLQRFIARARAAIYLTIMLGGNTVSEAGGTSVCYLGAIHPSYMNSEHVLIHQYRLTHVKPPAW